MSRKVVYFQRTVKPGEYAPREDALDVFLTDMQAHTQLPNNPRSLTRNFVRAFKKGGLDRSFTSNIKVLDKGKIEIGFDFDEEELLTYLQKRGKKMLRIYMPSGGLPMSLAEDALEKLRSIDKKLFEQPKPKK